MEEVGSPESMLELGEAGAELIRKRTRLGYGLDKQNGTKTKLSPLVPEYVKIRKNKITGPTTPAKSNLTVTGEMLDELHATADGQGSVTIGFDEGTKAADKAGWVSVLRPFNFLSKAEIAQLRKKLEEKVRIVLQKLR